MLVCQCGKHSPQMQQQQKKNALKWAADKISKFLCWLPYVDIFGHVIMMTDVLYTVQV